MAKRRIKRINKRRRQKIVRHTLPSNSNEMIQNAMYQSPGDFLKKSHRSQTSARARPATRSRTGFAAWR